MTLMKVCFGCKNPINDMYYLMVGNDFYWHISCLKCECCQSKMQNKCYFDDGKFYCLDDYLKIKQQKLMQMQYHQQQIDESKNYCNACKQLFNQNEYILNIQQQQYRYHIGCFVCTECQKQIPPGDQYGILNQLIYCSIHYNIKLNSMNFNDDRLILDRSNNNGKYFTLSFSLFLCTRALKIRLFEAGLFFLIFKWFLFYDYDTT